MEFKVGDIVEWCGVRGKVIGEDTSSKYINVKFDNNNEIYNDIYANTEVFYNDGIFRSYHKETSLKLIKRPKQKVKKYKVLFIDIYDEWQLSSSYFETLEKFDMHNIYKVKMLLEQTMVEDDE